MIDYEAVTCPRRALAIRQTGKCYSFCYDGIHKAVYTVNDCWDLAVVRERELHKNVFVLLTSIFYKTYVWLNYGWANGFFRLYAMPPDDS